MVTNMKGALWSIHGTLCDVAYDERQGVFTSA